VFVFVLCTHCCPFLWIVLVVFVFVKNWQHRVHKTWTNKANTIQRNWQDGAHKT
jgi:hypothetical protein